MRTLMQFMLGVGIGLWLRDIFYRDTSPRRIAAGADADSLRTISGIGPAFEEALHEVGIFTFAQLSRQNADTLAERLESRVPAERIRRERWIEQAKERSRS